MLLGPLLLSLSLSAHAVVGEPAPTSVCEAQVLADKKVKLYKLGGVKPVDFMLLEGGLPLVAGEEGEVVAYRSRKSKKTFKFPGERPVALTSQSDELATVRFESDLVAVLDLDKSVVTAKKILEAATFAQGAAFKLKNSYYKTSIAFLAHGLAQVQTHRKEPQWLNLDNPYNTNDTAIALSWDRDRVYAANEKGAIGFFSGLASPGWTGLRNSPQTLKRRAHERPVHLLELDPVRDVLASASVDGEIQLWNRDLSRCLGRIAGLGAITGLRFAGLGRYLMTEIDKKSVRVFELTPQTSPKYRLVRQIQLPSGARLQHLAVNDKNELCTATLVEGAIAVRCEGLRAN